MAKKNNIDKNYSGMKQLIKHIELMQKRQKILINLHDKGSLGRAASNAKENVISLILDYAHGYQAGETWPGKMFRELERKLESGHYFNNKHKEKK